MLKNPALNIFLLLISLIFYGILGYMGDLRGEIETYWFTIAPLYIIYTICIINVLNDKRPKNISFLWYIVIGLLFRIILIPSDPFLSDDIYRYLWDGKIISEGINPYKYAPADIHLIEFRDQIIHPNINFPEIATSYPPVSQFMFLLNIWFGGSVISWKILLLFAELGLVLVIFKLLDHFKLNKDRILIYFYNPLLIIETYSSGHLEITGVLFFWIAVLLFYKHFDWKSTLFLGISIMTKFIPLVSGIPFLSGKIIRKSGFLIIVCLFLLLPFMFSGILPLPGLFSYINRWEFNGGIYQSAISLLKILEVKEFQWMIVNFSGHSESFYFNYAFYYKIFAFIVFIVVIIDQIKKLKMTLGFRSINYLQKSFILTALFLLLTPTLHPWYLIWIIPFLVFTPNWSWILFTFLIQASYFVLKDYYLIYDWKESVWILLTQYIPFYTLLLWEYLDRKKIRGWFVG